ncbi:MAG TPA: copper-binding protein [Burkholderiaceae bacterium]|nr:copper-binding protein [Burkholderiaceae bacterium]
MKLSVLIVAAVLGASTAAHSQQATAPQAAASVATAMSEGEVRRVDKEQGKLTLKHGPIANLEMSAMTMVFKVADRKLLDGLKVGDKVRFAAENVNDVLTVTAIEPAR